MRFLFLLAFLALLLAGAQPAAVRASNSLGDDAARKAAEEHYGAGGASNGGGELILPPGADAAGEPEEAQSEEQEFAAQPGERRIPIQSWDGTISVADKPFIKLAQDNLDWEFYWSYTKEAPPRPLAEGAEIGVFVFAGERETGGYRAVIEGLRLDGDGAVVEWVEVTPAEDAMVTQARSYPWAIALFRHDGRELALLDSPPAVRVAAPLDSGVIGLPEPQEPSSQEPSSQEPLPQTSEPDVPQPEAPQVEEVEPEAAVLEEEGAPQAPLPEQPLEAPSLEGPPAEPAPLEAPIDLYLPPSDPPVADDGGDPLSGTLY